MEGWGCLISSRMRWIFFLLWHLHREQWVLFQLHMQQQSAGRIWDMKIIIGAFSFIGFFSQGSQPRIKYPAAQHFALCAPRNKESKWMLSIISNFYIYFCIWMRSTVIKKLFNCVHCECCGFGLFSSYGLVPWEWCQQPRCSKTCFPPPNGLVFSCPWIIPF